MNRKEFQTLALVRLREAETLLANALPDGAYYLAGYAVECALKACIARQTQRHDFPPDPRTVQAIYTHDLAQLMHRAGLMPALEARLKADRVFAANWIILKDWSEASRYNRYTMARAQGLYAAVADRQHGVLAWIRRFW